MIGAANVSGLITEHEAVLGAPGQQTKEKVQTSHATARRHPICHAHQGPSGKWKWEKMCKPDDKLTSQSGRTPQL